MLLSEMIMVCSVNEEIIGNEYVEREGIKEYNSHHLKESTA